jgi:hypothetical protein
MAIFELKCRQKASLAHTYWQKDPVEVVKKELIWLNTTEMDVDKCLNQFRLDSVRGVLLLMTTVVEGDHMTGVPFITILAAPLAGDDLCSAYEGKLCIV